LRRKVTCNFPRANDPNSLGKHVRYLGPFVLGNFKFLFPKKKLGKLGLNLLLPKEIVKNITIFFIYSSSMEKNKNKNWKNIEPCTFALKGAIITIAL
jgi:hypothetical protein